MNQEKLREYAELTVRIGAVVKPGQYVVIRANPEIEEFAAIVAEECYKAGAKRVVMSWRSFAVDRVGFKYASAEDLGRATAYDIGFEKFQTDELAVLIWLDGDDPDGLAGVDANKVAQARSIRYQATREYIDAREDKHQWTIVGVPTPKWAKKVFPDLAEEEAVEKLWDAVLYTARCDKVDAVEAWKAHEEELKNRCDVLNSLKLRKLKYSSKNGTDLEIGLIPGVIFLGGAEKTIDGTSFQPNIPTEECFTSPRRGEAEGIVYASKPLAYQGQLIDKFWMRFHEGKVVDCGAEKGEAALRSILTLDEGASYLGEAALVPFDSPINQTGLLFYSTLYDENACCHLAIGTGFPNLYPNFEKYTLEEITKFGINHSLSHVDFMIGTADLSIVGVKEDGTEVQLFKNGTWAF